LRLVRFVTRTDGINGDLAKRPSQIPAQMNIAKPRMRVTSTCVEFQLNTTPPQLNPMSMRVLAVMINPSPL
jgi:hypothetical protein